MPRPTSFLHLLLLASSLSLAGCASSQRGGAPQGGTAPGGPGASHDALPADVRSTLDRYVGLLRQSRTIDEAAAGFVSMAGGGLVDESGSRLRTDVPQFSLKKDWTDVKVYADPVQVTRVDVDPDASQGLGPSALRGRVYKIWIAKAAGQPGMPAPISIMVPVGHPTIQGPRVVGIGSL